MRVPTIFPTIRDQAAEPSACKLLIVKWLLGLGSNQQPSG